MKCLSQRFVLSASNVSHLVSISTMTEPRTTRSLPDVHFTLAEDSLPPPLPERDYPPPLPPRCVPPTLPARDYVAKPPRLPERDSTLPAPSIPPRHPITVEPTAGPFTVSGNVYANGQNDGTWEWRMRVRLPDRNVEVKSHQLPNSHLAPVPPPCPATWKRLPADIPSEIAPSPPHDYLTMKK